MQYKIRELRKEKEMTQNELCEKAKISRATLWMLETGEKHNASTDTLLRIANALGCSVADIIS